MNKSEINIGKLLKENNAIFNYIYNDFGYRIGIIVAKKGKTRGDNPIGWVLFNEISSIESSYEMNFKKTPIYKNMKDALKSSISRISSLKKDEDIKLIKDLGIFDCFKALNDILDTSLFGRVHSDYIPLKYSLTHEDIVNAIIIALNRANYNTQNYYAPKNTGHYLKENIVDGMTLDKEAKILRRVIKKMEYRAWRYFK